MQLFGRCSFGHKLPRHTQTDNAVYYMHKTHNTNTHAHTQTYNVHSTHKAYMHITQTCTVDNKIIITDHLAALPKM